MKLISSLQFPLTLIQVSAADLSLLRSYRSLVAQIGDSSVSRLPPNNSQEILSVVKVRPLSWPSLNFRENMVRIPSISAFGSVSKCEDLLCPTLPVLCVCVCGGGVIFWARVTSVLAFLLLCRNAPVKTKTFFTQWWKKDYYQQSIMKEKSIRRVLFWTLCSFSCCHRYDRIFDI